MTGDGLVGGLIPQGGSHDGPLRRRSPRLIAAGALGTGAAKRHGSPSSGADVLALARQMATDETVESAAVDEVVPSGAGVCTEREPGSSDGSAAASDAAAPWAGAHSGQSARGGTSVGRCAANEPFSASPGGYSAGRCAHQRHDGAHYLAHGGLSAASHALPDRVGTAESDEAAASSTSGGAP